MQVSLVPSASKAWDPEGHGRAESTRGCAEGHPGPVPKLSLRASLDRLLDPEPAMSVSPRLSGLQSGSRRKGTAEPQDSTPPYGHMADSEYLKRCMRTLTQHGVSTTAVGAAHDQESLPAQSLEVLAFFPMQCTELCLSQRLTSMSDRAGRVFRLSCIKGPNGSPGPAAACGQCCRLLQSRDLATAARWCSRHPELASCRTDWLPTGMCRLRRYRRQYRGYWRCHIQHTSTDGGAWGPWA